MLDVRAIVFEEVDDPLHALSAYVGEVMERSRIVAVCEVEQHPLSQRVLGCDHLFDIELLEDLLEQEGSGHDDVASSRIEPG